MIHRPHGLIQQADAFRRQWQARRTQALEQRLQRRQNLCQQGDVDHRDGAMQSMHGPQQSLSDRQLTFATLNGCANGLQVLTNLTAKDLEQHRIDCRQRWHLDRMLMLVRHRYRTDGIGVGKRCPGHGIGGCFNARNTANHHAANRFQRTWRLILQPRRLASRQLFCGMHDRTQRSIRRALALERGQQRRQRRNGMLHQILRVLIRLDGLVEDPVEHVLHFPCEFTEHTGANESP